MQRAKRAKRLWGGEATMCRTSEYSIIYIIYYIYYVIFICLLTHFRYAQDAPCSPCGRQLASFAIPLHSKMLLARLLSLLPLLTRVTLCCPLAAHISLLYLGLVWGVEWALFHLYRASLRMDTTLLRVDTRV